MKSVFSEEFDDDLGLSPDDKLKESVADHMAMHCSSCGVAWDAHLGLTGTCQQLSEAKAENKVLRTAFCIRDDETVVSSVEGSILIDNKGGTRRRYFVATDEERNLNKELIEARKRCEELAKQVTERDTLILQLCDNLIVKDMEIRELKLDLEEGQ